MINGDTYCLNHISNSTNLHAGRLNTMVQGSQHMPRLRQKKMWKCWRAGAQARQIQGANTAH
jgi:hypothetical protein